MIIYLIGLFNNFMHKKNKKKSLVSLFLLLLIVVPQISLASAISLRSSTTKVEPTKTFTLSIYADPKSVASYTTQANIKFPADLVSLESFTYTSSWIEIKLSGYDLIDNINGKLIKTAGYPNGFSTETLLGTAVFRAKKAGTVVISTEKESYILDIDSNNTLNTYGSFSITAGTTVVAPPTNPTPPPTTPITPPVVKTPVVVKTPTVTKTPVVAKTETKPTEEIVETPVVSIPEQEVKNKTAVLFWGIIFGALSAYLGFH